MEPTLVTGAQSHMKVNCEEYGMGREDLRYSIEEMTERKLLMMNLR